MDRLGIEFICALGMPPVEFVALAAELGVGSIGLAPSPITANPYGFPTWDLRSDPGLKDRTRAALAEHGVTISVGEGFLIMPGLEIADAEATLDLMAELGAPRVNCVAVDPERSRGLEQFARFAEMAAARGQDAMLEFMPMLSPATIGEALAFVTDSGAPNGKLLVDAMHFFRFGGQIADLAAIDPGRIGHIQICDVPMPARTADYGEEARHDRLCPGEGDLPLADFLKALPSDVNVGLEVPMVSRAKAGTGLRELLVHGVAAARRLLAAG